MTRVLPGGVLSAKMSSEVMQCSRAPGKSGYFGLPPTATTKASAVMVVFLPFLSTASTVFGLTKVAKAL